MEEFEDSPLDEAFERTFEPREEPDLPEHTVQQEEEPLSFDEQAAIYSGHLTTSVKIGTHTVGLRTLRVGEELDAALVADKYKDTVEAARALATALVAAAITSVDDKPLINEVIGPGDFTLEAKFQHLLRNWYWPPVQKLYREYGDLVERMQEVFESVGKG